MKKAAYTVAIVGATGAVGQEMIALLEQRDFPVRELRLFASEQSHGQEMTYCDAAVLVQRLTPEAFAGVDVALFSAGGDISREYAPKAADAGAWVIDNSSAFRMDDDVPLVVPEVNADDIELARERRIIANPNCSTIQLVTVLAPLHAKAKIRRAVVSTYQSVSGAGRSAMEELSSQTADLFQHRDPKPQRFPHQIAFNCLPHIDVFLSDGFTKEERKIMDETRKIMRDDEMRVVATAVRVPVFCSHAEAVTLECSQPIAPEEARELLSAAPGIEVIDDPATCAYPLQVQAAGQDPVYVGRIRRDPTVEHGLVLWIVADNLRKGAALNAMQIAELLREKGMM